MTDEAERWTYVTGGSWMYQGVVPQRISIYRSRLDLNYELLVDDAHYAEDPEAFLEGEEPVPAGPDGWLYYTKEADSGPLPSLEAAKAWVEAQPWGKVTWDR